jgi:hypothetical protein
MLLSEAVCASSVHTAHTWAHYLLRLPILGQDHVLYMPVNPPYVKRLK